MHISVTMSLATIALIGFLLIVIGYSLHLAEFLFRKALSRVAADTKLYFAHRTTLLTNKVLSVA